MVGSRADLVGTSVRGWEGTADGAGGGAGLGLALSRLGAVVWEDVGSGAWRAPPAH